MILNGDCPQAIERAVEVLRRGELVAFPTETVYGLGADATNGRAVARVFSVKGRPTEHPLIVHLAEASEIDRWAQDIPPVGWRLAERFWPGPLTLILKRAPHVLNAVTGGQDTIGLRVPGHPVALALLKAFGGGVAAPSANRFGRLSPTTADHVATELGDAVTCILDGGPCSVGVESTILDLSGARPRLLRPGGLTPADLAEILGEPPAARSADAPRVPGAMPAHYAPGTPLYLVDPAVLEPTLRALQAAGQAVAVLSMCPPPPDLTGDRWWWMPTDPKAYAHQLYARLREADASGSRCILVEQPPVTAPWEAVRDRLERASAGAGRVEAGLA